METFILGWWWTSHQSLFTQKSTYFQILYCVLERWTRTLNQILLGKTDWVGSRVHRKKVDTIDGEPMESEWNISQHWLLHSLSTKSKSSWTWAAQHNSKDALSSCRCLTISYGDLKTMNGNVLQTPHLCLYLRKRFPAGRWSFLGLGSEKKWFSTYIDRPRGECDRVAELMMIMFAESGHPVFRATSPFSRGTLQSKGGGKLSIHFCADGDTIDTFSHNNFC